ncbi:MAG: LamG-like jellyroll fold domain-containing protein, partial [Thermodesulfovibrionales bacterium]
MEFKRFNKATIILFVLLLTSIFGFVPFIYAQTEGCPSEMLHYWKLDEGSQPYTDFYGSSNATCSNCPTAVTGIVDGAQRFSSSNRVNVADDSTFDWTASDSFSIEFWMKTEASSTCSGTQVIIGRDDVSTPLHWWVGCWDGGKAGFVLRDKNNNIAILNYSNPSAKDITDGEWHHIVAIRDSSTNEVSLYVDGVKEASTTTVYTGDFDSTANINIGWLNTGSYYYFVGNIDEVAVYNRVLTDNEILSHYYLARNYCEMCDNPVRIMPLGDSITYGRRTWPDPEFEPYGPDSPNYVVGYRQTLYLLLQNSGYYFDFVGSMQDGELATPSFDLDHQGVLDSDGFTAQEMASNVYNFLSANPADVVLLHIGTNNILNTTANDIENILNEIDRYDTNIAVLLALIINVQDSNDPRYAYITQFNSDVASMAMNRINDKVIIVDQENSLTYPNDMYDMLHPNTTGYGKMADKWFNALSSFLPVCGDIAPMITSTPDYMIALGQTYTYDVNSTGNPAPTYSLATAPLGMNINSSTGLIEWTPTSYGTFNVVVEATNSVGTDTQSFTIQVLSCPSEMLHYWKLDEGSQPYTDFYGSSNATCSNCPTAVTGIVDGAQRFSSSNRVNVADDSTFDWTASDSFSIEFWMKTEASSTCSGTQVIIGRDDVSTPLHWWVGCWDGGKAGFVLRDKNNNIAILNYSNPSAKDITDGEWHHIVAIRDSSTNEVSLYVDGVKEASTTTVYTGDFDSTANINIGWLNTGSYYYFVGNIDEVAVYNRALTDSEVLQHYNDGNSGYGYCTMPTYTLTIAGSGNGSGTVTGSGINCTITSGVASGDCTESYDAGTEVTLTANADSDSAFSGWSGDCTGTGTCNLTMDSDKNVTATFTIKTFTITGSAPGGHGTISCTSPVNYGGTSTCTITPDVNYHLSALTDNGTDVLGSVVNDQYMITNVTANHTVVATFSIDTYTVTPSAGANGSINPSTPQTVNHGSTISFTVTPDTGYHVASVTGCGGTWTGTNPFTTGPITADCTVTATFAINSYTVTGSVLSGQGTISCVPSSVNHGGSSTCTITPNAHYHLSALTDNGDNVIGSVVNNQYTITNIIANHTITATFAIETYTITTKPGTGGSITCSPNPVEHGGTSVCTVKPDAGYYVYSVRVDGSPAVLTYKKYTFENVTTNHKIAVTFAPYTTVKLISPNSEGIPSGSQWYIRWQAPPNSKIKLLLSLDNAQTWSLIEKDITDTMKYLWTVPTVSKDRRECFIKVIAYNSKGVKIGEDISDSPFKIKIAKVLTPNDAGISLKSGYIYNITWT